jgi:hypothetical protein
MKKINSILLIVFALTAQTAFSQSIVIGSGAEINLGAGTDICATAYGNITGLLTGTGANCTQAMPVEMMSFSAAVNQNNVNLSWQTSSEINNRGFEIYRSDNNTRLHWNVVGFVKGNGTKTTPTNYTYSDAKIKTGKYYYRIKQIDNNGNMQYYELNNIVNVSLPGKFELMQNYPNPFNPLTKISFTLPVDSKVSLIVYDIEGRKVSEILNNIFLVSDYYSFEFNAANLSSGIYFYRIVTDNNSSVKKMVLIK